MSIGVTFTTTQVICLDHYFSDWVEDEYQAGGWTEDTAGEPEAWTEESVGADGWTEE